MRALVLWSGGKDSLMALVRFRAAHPDARVELMTTVSEQHDRVTMHGVRRTLVERQARALGLPLRIVRTSSLISCPDHRALIVDALGRAREEGFTHVVSGDLFLEEIREWREDVLREVGGLAGVYPIWGEPTLALAERFIAEGYQATLTCVDGRVMDAHFAGDAFDRALLAKLPDGVDPCGENGEFHTFVSAGPGFSSPLRVRAGERVTHDERFHFCDLLEEGRAWP